MSHRQESDSAVANLSLAILTLKNLGNKWSMTASKETVIKVERLIAETSSAELSCDFYAFLGVLVAVRGEKTGAKGFLNLVLQLEPVHRVARAALDVLPQ